MKSKVLKGAMLIAVLGTVCQFSSCLTRGLALAVNHVGFEFLVDNDQIVDLFSD